MEATNNLTIPLKIDLGQFLQFFSQLSPENKAMIMNALQAFMPTKPAKSPQPDFPLKGSVKSYLHPFEPVAENDWEALA